MHKKRLSFSTLDLIHSCERKYQIEKLLVGAKREESEHLSFGNAYGVGVATYLITQDQDLALFKMFCAYTPLIETDKKSLLRCSLALMRSFAALDTILQEWEVVEFNGKPAAEMSFRIDIDDDYYYVGYIDAVLRNRYTGVHCVFECKTTGLLLNDLTPLYKHSGQALGYSVVLDKICGENLSSYTVLYFVCQLGKDFADVKCIPMPFKKTLLDRLNWFIVLGLDVEHLHAMEGLNVYPRRYTSCLRFNRPCRHFGTCHLHAHDIPLTDVEEDTIEYQFCYKLEELMEDHLRRVQDLPLEAGETDVVSMDGIVDMDAIVDLDSLLPAPADTQEPLPAVINFVVPPVKEIPVATPVVETKPLKGIAAILAAKKAKEISQ